MAEIWICNPFDNLPDEGAKPQRYALLAEEFAKLGHSVTWWSADFSHAKKAKRQSPSGTVLPQTFTMQNGVKVHLIPTIPYKKNISLTRIKSHRAFAKSWLDIASETIDAGNPKPDTIIISTPPLSTYKTADCFRKKWGSKIVLDIMDAWPKAFERLLPKPKSLTHLLAAPFFAPARMAAFKAYNGADKITAISKNYLKMAQNAGSKAPMASFYHTCQKITQPPCITNDDKTLRIVYLGNMGAFYALDTVIAAVKNLESKAVPVRLDLIGTGPDEMRLRKMSEGSSVIHFHGFLNAAELSAGLSTAHIGLIPMHTESAVAVPYKLPDYASYGLPVLNSLKGECSSLIQRYNAGITYEAESAESLEKAILHLLNNPPLRSDFQNGAINLAKNEFLAENIYPAFVNFILE